MKPITLFLPDSTLQKLSEDAQAAGIGIEHYCSNLLTDSIAQNSPVAVIPSANGLRAHTINTVRIDPLPKPDQMITEKDLVKQVLTFLQRRGGSEQKAIVEKSLFEANKGDFSKPYWQVLVGGGVPRWKKNIQFARNTACKFGWIKSPEDSGRGIWELTDKGRQWKPE